jgi:hypothetical protein
VANGLVNYLVLVNGEILIVLVQNLLLALGLPLEDCNQSMSELGHIWFGKKRNEWKPAQES